MEELISVIVPVYNVEKYLHHCIDSIRSQSYKNIEIILIDDGSLDNCGKICDEYAVLDKRIKVLHKKNGGLSDARNEGVEISQGGYLSFVDSDDFVHVNYIERLYKLLKEFDADISVCRHFTTTTDNIEEDVSDEKVFEYSNIEALQKIYENLGVTTWGKLYKRYLFEKKVFPVGKIHEDEFVTYKLFYKSRKIVWTTRKLLFYRQRKDGLTGGGFVMRYYLEAFLERAKFFQSVGLNKLSERTYRVAFSTCLFGLKKIDKHDNQADLYEYKKNLKELRRCLRKNTRKTRCKIFYELYFIMPGVADFFHRMTKK